MTSLPSNGTDTTLFLKQNSTTKVISYSSTSTGIYTDITLFPITFNSISALSVKLTTAMTIDSTINSNNSLFIIGSDDVTFDGQTNVININGITNYKGLFQNGTFGGVIGNATASSSKVGATINNVTVTVSSSTLNVNTSTGEFAGWLCAAYFSKSLSTPSDYSVFSSCSSNGIIGNGCGGLVGSYSNILTMTSCTSSGAISGDGAGGLLGAYCLSSSSSNPSLITCSTSGVISGANAGGLCGTGCNTIKSSKCFSTGDITGAGAGGIFGSLNNHIATSLCKSSGIISGTGAGGIVGTKCFNSTIEVCFSRGNITGTGAGGIVGSYFGYNYSSAQTTVKNCYSNGDISGSNAGGIIGSDLGNSDSGVNVTVTFEQCYSTGAITGNAGGIVGGSINSSTSSGTPVYASTGGLYVYGSYPVTITGNAKYVSQSYLSIYSGMVTLIGTTISGSIAADNGTYNSASLTTINSGTSGTFIDSNIYGPGSKAPILAAFTDNLYTPNAGTGTAFTPYVTTSGLGATGSTYLVSYTNSATTNVSINSSTGVLTILSASGYSPGTDIGPALEVSGSGTDIGLATGEGSGSGTDIGLPILATGEESEAGTDIELPVLATLYSASNTNISYDYIYNSQAFTFTPDSNSYVVASYTNTKILAGYTAAVTVVTAAFPGGTTLYQFYDGITGTIPPIQTTVPSGWNPIGNSASSVPTSIQGLTAFNQKYVSLVVSNTESNGVSNVTTYYFSKPVLMTVYGVLTSGITISPAFITIGTQQYYPSPTATLTAGVSGGTGPYSYSWSKNASRILGATSASYSATSFSPNDEFTCNITDSTPVGTANGGGLIPTFPQQSQATYIFPASFIKATSSLNNIITTPYTTINSGSTASTVFTATGSGGYSSVTNPYTFTWSKNNSVMVGETSSTLTVPNIFIGNNDEYYSTITNGAPTSPLQTQRSNTITMSVINNTFSGVTILSSTNEIKVNEQLTLVATFQNGGNPYTYAWTKNNGSTIEIVSTGVSINSSNTYIHTVLPAASGKTLTYVCTVTDSSGIIKVSNEISVSVYSADLSVSISIVPSQSSISSGKNYTLTANPSGGFGTYKYQWKLKYKYGTTNCGATKSITKSQTIPDTYTYTVVVTDATSSTAISNEISIIIK
jgi:hypothetical protein